MHEGQTIKHITGEGAPLKSPALGLVAASLTSGIAFASDKPLLDTVEEIDGEAVRKFVWSFDGGRTATFRPSFKEETIDLHEMGRRFNDAAWCAANADHPIAFMRAMFDQLCALRVRLREMKPLLKIVKSGGAGSRSIALIPQDADPARKAELLAELDRA